MFIPYSAEVVAQTINDSLEAAVDRRGFATLAIPGGRSPGAVLTALAGIMSPFLAARTRLLWVDERAVPLGHPERNDHATLAAWRAGGPVPGAVYAMPAQGPDLEAACEDYARTLVAATGGSGVLDVCLLGIGEDGHIASLFPNHDGLKELTPVFAVYDSPKPPAQRMTLSLPLLATARQRFVLALGAHKRALAQLVESGERSERLPVSLLPPSVWYIDS